MNIAGKFFLVFLLCVFISTQPFHARAASKGKRPTLAESRSSVEINLDVLDQMGLPAPDKNMPIAPLAGPPPEDFEYTPPPMFEMVPRTRLEADKVERRAQEQIRQEAQKPSPQQAYQEPLTPMPQQVYMPYVEAPVQSASVPIKRSKSSSEFRKETRDPEYLRRQEVRTTVISLPDPKKPEPVVKKAVAAKVEPVKAQPLHDDELREDEMAIHTAQDVYNALNDIKPNAGDSNIKISGDQTSFAYQRGAIILEEPMKQAIVKNILPKLAKKEARVEIQAHAAPSTDGPTSARRLSLARALEVRDFLVSHKISSKKIDIKPLGDLMASEMADSQADRVDIYVR